VGVTSAGTALRVNPLVKAADLVLAVGSILPHRYCGWSGGGKIVLPGVSSLEAIAAMHLRVTRDSSIRLGAPDNAARREMDEQHASRGCSFS
jgi:nickel-dependent lactate racemase